MQLETQDVVYEINTGRSREVERMRQTGLRASAGTEEPGWVLWSLLATHTPDLGLKKPATWKGQPEFCPHQVPPPPNERHQRKSSAEGAHAPCCAGGHVGTLKLHLKPEVASSFWSLLELRQRRVSDRSALCHCSLAVRPVHPFCLRCYRKMLNVHISTNVLSQTIYEFAKQIEVFSPVSSFLSQSSAQSRLLLACTTEPCSHSLHTARF